MAGRPPKPTRLKLLQGNPGKRPLPKDEPKPELGIPTRPEWLSAEGKREWNRVTRELNKMGLLAKIDRALLASYCQCWATYVEAAKALQPKRRKGEDGKPVLEDGKPVLEEASLTFTTDKGYIGPRPEIGIASQMLAKMTQLSAKFGFSPSDRAKMAMPEPKDENPLAQFLNKGKAVG